MSCYVLDAHYLTEPVSAQYYLAWELHLPTHYGHNLDALADCLGEMGEGTEIVLQNAAACTGYAERVRRVLRDCAQNERAYRYIEE